jgi:hypothetical protein
VSGWEVWRCQRCDRAHGSSGLTILLDRRYARGKCGHCRKTRLFIRPAAELEEHGQARSSDPATSHAAAATIRTGSAKMALLQAHARHPEGLTDEEAARHAGLSLASEYATRCSELQRAGLLDDTTDTRTGRAGMQRLVRVITPSGLRHNEALGDLAERMEDPF